VNAAHFRRRAAEAREMAGFGQDAGLVDLLLEVARDLDAEADAMDAGVERNRRATSRIPGDGIPAIVHSAALFDSVQSLLLSDLSVGGALLAGRAAFRTGSNVILDIPSCGLRVSAQVTRVEPNGIALAFRSDADTLRDVDRAIGCLEELRRADAAAAP
jgi:hypothetical protein